MPQSSRVMATLEASALSRATSSPEAEAVPPTANRRTTLISKVILGIARVGARKTSTMTMAPQLHQRHRLIPPLPVQPHQLPPHRSSEIPDDFAALLRYLLSRS